MTYVLAVLITLLLLSAFLAFTGIETHRGVRIFAAPRRRFDRQVSRMTYIATHIDWGSFFAHIARSLAERIAHDVVHTVLLAVRATERILTRTIRTLRERVAHNAPPGERIEGSQLIATIIRFRKNLKRERPNDMKE